jgi:hypothetical protein
MGPADNTALCLTTSTVVTETSANIWWGNLSEKFLKDTTENTSVLLATTSFSHVFTVLI